MKYITDGLTFQNKSDMIETKKGDFVSMRERIIIESIESLRQEGLRFSVDTLAQRLNISKKTVYKYFPNKEALAVALYQRYYSDTKARAEQLAAENTADAHSKLLGLYFDAKQMTSRDIFNKYKLNEALFSYTLEQNNGLWGIILSSMSGDISDYGKASLQIIVDGSFEKLCNEKIAPDGVIERLMYLLW